MRPGKPMMHGRLGGMRVLGLPGNPVSAYVCALLFLVPLIRKLAGRTDLDRTATNRRCSAATCRENDERADYLRATPRRTATELPVATPFPNQDSSMLVPLAAPTASWSASRTRRPPRPARAAPSLSFAALLAILRLVHPKLKGCGTISNI